MAFIRVMGPFYNDDVFQSYLSSVYGCQLWTDYKSTVLKKAMVATMYTGGCLISNEMLACLRSMLIIILMFYSTYS